MDDVSVLKAALATWTRLGDVSLMVVAVGAILAAMGEFEWSRILRLPKWQRAIGAIGAVLVLAGIGGEMLAARKSRVINDEIAAVLNARAAAANQAANAL